MLGIIAGKGQLIRNLIQECDYQKRPYIVLAFEGQTDPQLVKSKHHAWTKLGKIGYTLNLLKQNNVTEIVMAGHFKRPIWHELQVDVRGMRWMRHLIGQSFGDDSLLKKIIKLIESEGYKVISPESILGSNLFITKGTLSTLMPSEKEWQDINQGCKILHHLASMDVGQAIVIQQELVLGIEAIEGTQELIRRCNQYKRDDVKPVLIKLCKYNQETRVDRPTVGLDTIKAMIEYGYAGMALEAHGVIVLDQQEIITTANKHNLFIVGITS